MTIDTNLIIEVFTVSVQLAIMLLLVFLGIIILVARFVMSRNSRSKREKVYIDMLITTCVSLLITYFIYNNKGYFDSMIKFKQVALTFIMTVIALFFIMGMIVTMIMWIFRRIKSNF